jgi:hypothetical protein
MERTKVRFVFDEEGLSFNKGKITRYLTHLIPTAGTLHATDQGPICAIASIKEVEDEDGPFLLISCGKRVIP